MQYDVYPLPVAGFRDLPRALQVALVKRTDVHELEHAESFEYLTRSDGQHVVRVNLRPRFIELVQSEDKTAVTQLAKLSNIKKKKSRGLQQRHVTS